MADEQKKILDDIIEHTKLKEGGKEYYLSALEKFISTVEEKKDTIKSGHPISFLSVNIEQIEEKIEDQLNEILHAPNLQELEASWRGLFYLLSNTAVSSRLKIRVLNASKKDIFNDLTKALEFDQSQLFKKVYEEEYGTFGGHPFSAMMVDYYFDHEFNDMLLLEKLSNVMATALVPTIAAASPSLFDLHDFTELGHIRDLAKKFESVELAKWSGFRESEDSRYIAMVMPSVMVRMPYDRKKNPVEGLNFSEDVTGYDHKKYCWGSAGYMLATKITRAFSLYGWTAAIRGVEGGGLVDGLPTHTFKTVDGDIAMKCPTEVTITDRREKELSDLGFIALCHCKNTDYAVFFGGQSTQRAKVYNKDDATANAELSARLPYLLNASRFGHYLKAMMRDKIGSFETAAGVAKYLNNWLAEYILLQDDAQQEAKAKFPLREGRVDVFDIPGHPGAYNAVVYLRPHFQLEELTASIRLVAKLPEPAS